MLDVSKIVEAIPNIQPDKVIPELKAFASTYKQLQKGLFEPESDYETDSETDSDDEKDTDDEKDIDDEKENKDENVIEDRNDERFTESQMDQLSSESSSKKENCKDCLSCIFKLLIKYQLCSESFENLCSVYKYLLTLSITQCSCERSFSKLKIIKSRLRSTLTQHHLESIMLISVEKTIARKLRNDKESIIDRFANTSKELSALLLL